MLYDEICEKYNFFFNEKQILENFASNENNNKKETCISSQLFVQSLNNYENR